MVDGKGIAKIVGTEALVLSGLKLLHDNVSSEQDKQLISAVSAVSLGITVVAIFSRIIKK